MFDHHPLSAVAELDINNRREGHMNWPKKWIDFYMIKHKATYKAAFKKKTKKKQNVRNKKFQTPTYQTILTHWRHASYFLSLHIVIYIIKILKWA